MSEIIMQSAARRQAVAEISASPFGKRMSMLSISCKDNGVCRSKKNTITKTSEYRCLSNGGNFVITLF